MKDSFLYSNHKEHDVQDAVLKSVHEELKSLWTYNAMLSPRGQCLPRKLITDLLLIRTPSSLIYCTGSSSTEMQFTCVSHTFLSWVSRTSSRFSTETPFHETSKKTMEEVLLEFQPRIDEHTFSAKSTVTRSSKRLCFKSWLNFTKRRQDLDMQIQSFLWRLELLTLELINSNPFWMHEKSIRFKSIPSCSASQKETAKY